MMKDIEQLSREQVLLNLARAYRDAVRGAHYSPNGNNRRAEGVVSAAAYILGMTEDDADAELDAAMMDLPEEE